LFENIDIFIVLKFYIFLYFLVENTCHTTRTVGQTLKEKENNFGIFENKCHTVRATGRTQWSERERFYSFIYEL